MEKTTKKTFLLSWKL